MKKEGLHARAERVLKSIETRIETAVAAVEEAVDGRKLAVGDRVRSITAYRRGMSGVVARIDADVVVVDIDSQADGRPCVIQCHFQRHELEGL